MKSSMAKSFKYVVRNPQCPPKSTMEDRGFIAALLLIPENLYLA